MRATLSDMDVAGSDLKKHLGRKFCAKADPRFSNSPSYSFGGKSTGELNLLASNRPFFCKTGTHRCPQGELLLDRLRRRDDKTHDELRDTGRQWKATPGPGTYRIPRVLGNVLEPSEEAPITLLTQSRTPTWRVGSGKRPQRYQTLGGGGHAHEHEGRLRTPTPRNISPGPGRYFQDCDSCPSLFADYTRPQGRQVV